MSLHSILFSALSAISFFATAYAGHAEAYGLRTQHHQLRRQAAPPGYVNVPLSELQELRNEYNSFRGWLTSYISSAGPSDTKAAQLSVDIKAYEVWVEAFFSRYANNTSGRSASFGTALAEIGPRPTYSLPEPVIPTTNSVPVTNSVTVTPAVAIPTSPYSIPMNHTSNNSTSHGSVAVYYGQTPATNKVTLDTICQDNNVDIVVLAFLTYFVGPGGLPTINFGPACSDTLVPGAKARNATGLLDCSFLAKNITTCQGLGKKVLLSLGGSLSNVSLESDAHATQVAYTLWNIFGGGTNSSDLRPFGSVKLDGFDVDNEDHSTKYYNTFVSALRNTFAGDKSKRYYISAAPQCVRPDASIPLEAMQTMDYVFVQFYNNEPAGCDVGQPGFIDSFKAWSGDLSGNSTLPGKGPKMYIGAPACEKCAGNGYLDPAKMTAVIRSAMTAGVSNFGGVMLWDGSEAKVNVGNGSDYVQVVKSAMS